MTASRRFTDLVGCRLPIQLASLGGPVGTPALAAAVTEAGGLGMIPNPSAAEVEGLVAEARQGTSGPIGIGFLIPFVEAEAVEVAAEKADVVEFFYGEPDLGLVTAAKASGAVVGWQVGSAAEAEAAAGCGCAYVVAQGIEAGGHVRGTQVLDTVLAETLDRVDVPVLAAGGIGTAAQVAAALGAGADAVRIGTRFVAAEESDAHPDYVALLIAATAADTVLTETFDIGWPDAPHRVLRSAVDASGEAGDSPIGMLGEIEIPARFVRTPTSQIEGRIGAMALYAGESVGAVTGRQPAAEIFTELVAELPG